MKLVSMVGSNNFRKSMAVINHLGIDVEIEYLDLFQGDLQKAEYLALNPNGKVPTLVDGDFILWESNAINQYLCDKTPGNTLYPREPRQRADIQRWLCWELAHYNNAFGTLVWETVAKPHFLGREVNQAVAAWAEENLLRYVKVLEQHLQNRLYMVGDSVTIADYAIIHIEWFKEMVPFDWSSYPNVNAYYEHMRENEYWAATAPASPEEMGKKPKVA